MPSTIPRAPLIAAILLALAGVAPTAHAFNGHGRGLGVIPTVYEPTVLAVPTTSYVTTSYYTPASYSSVLYPTVYTSSILTPTYYVEPTSYVVPTVFRSRWRRAASRPIYTTSRSYYYDLTPTSYAWSTYWPTTTTLDVPLVVSPTMLASTEDCYVDQASAVITSPSSAINPAPRSNTSPRSNPAPSEGVNPRPPLNLESRPTNGGSAEPTPIIPDGPAPAAPPAADATSGLEPGLDFRGEPIPEKGVEPAGDQALPPISPPGGPELGPDASGSTRSSYRPAPTEMAPRPALPALGALRGSVISTTALKPEAGVRVVFADSRGRYGDRETASDAEGRFEVSLPDGDWRVSVEGADGKLTPYGNVTVASGRFYDERGRVVSSLRLHH